MNTTQGTPTAPNNESSAFWPSWWLYILPTFIIIRFSTRYFWPEVSYWKAIGIGIVAVSLVGVLSFLGRWVCSKLRPRVTGS